MCQAGESLDRGNSIHRTCPQGAHRLTQKQVTFKSLHKLMSTYISTSASFERKASGARRELMIEA